MRVWAWMITSKAYNVGKCVRVSQDNTDLTSQDKNVANTLSGISELQAPVHAWTVLYLWNLPLAYCYELSRRKEINIWWQQVNLRLQSV